MSIPGDFPPGMYHMLGVVDPFDMIAETDELNNIFDGGQVEILAGDVDLTLQSTHVNLSEVKAGDILPVGGQMINLGNARAQYIDISYYLSDDDMLSHDDQYLSGGFIEELGAGQGTNLRYTFVYTGRNADRQLLCAFYY